jgi:TonB-dependent receptor
MPTKLQQTFLCALIGVFTSISSAADLPSDDNVDGVVSPSIVFLPRQVREVFIFHEPSTIDVLSETYWLTDWDEHEAEKEGATDQALGDNSIYEKRIGGLVTLKTRSHDQVDSEYVDLRTRALYNDRFDDELGSDVRARFRYGFGDAMDSGIVAYYRHRERQVGSDSESTDWARAENTADTFGKDAVFIDEHEIRSSPEDQVMDELGAKMDWWLTPQTSLVVSGVYRESEETLIEQREEFDTRSGTEELSGQSPNRGNQYSSGTLDGNVLVSGQSLSSTPRIEYQVKDEVEQKRRWGGDAALRHEFDDRTYVQVDAEYAYKEKAEPDRQDVEFGRKSTAFSYELVEDDGDIVPVFSGDTTSQIGADYGLRKLELEDNLEREWYQQYRAIFNVALSSEWELQTGGFYHSRRYSEDIDYERYEDPNWQDSGELYSAGDFLNSDGELSASELRNIDTGTLTKSVAESAFKTWAEDFDSERTIVGGWAQLRWEPSKAFRAHAGLRFERSEGDYDGYNAQWNGEEDFGNIIFTRTPYSVTEVSAQAEHQHLLPYLRLEYQVHKNLHFSVDLRQSLQRAELWELAATESYDLDGGTAPEAILGNPDLDPSVQTQLTLAANWAYAPGSMLRFYAEYWDMSNPITRASWFQAYELEDASIDGNFEANYRFEQSINADSGKLYRAGLNWTHLLSQLPHPFDQLGFFGTLEVTRSEQSVTVDGAQRTTDLISMPELRSTLGLYYDSTRWNASLYGQFHNDYIYRIGESRDAASGAGDQFVDDRITLNFTFDYQITSNLDISFAAENLLDSPLRLYEGSEQRQTYREYIGRSFYVGLHYFF